MKANRSIRLLLLLLVALLLCGGCQTELLRNTQKPELDKEQIIKLYDENKDKLCEILEYAEMTEGGMDADISNGYSRFLNISPNGVEEINDKKVIANLKSLHKKIGLLGADEIYGGGVTFAFAYQDEKGVLYTKTQNIHAEGFSVLEKIDDNWYYYEIQTPD